MDCNIEFHWSFHCKHFRVMYSYHYSILQSIHLHFNLINIYTNSSSNTSTYKCSYQHFLAILTSLHRESGCCGIANICSDLTLPVLRPGELTFPAPANQHSALNHSITQSCQGTSVLCGSSVGRGLELKVWLDTSHSICPWKHWGDRPLKSNW